MTTLYRYFDKHGTLLYVGIASNVKARLRQHARNSPWFMDAASITIEHYTNQDEARAAELEAIKAELPAWNIMASPNAAIARSRRSQWVPPLDDFYESASFESAMRLYAIAQVRCRLIDDVYALERERLSLSDVLPEPRK